MSPEIGLIIAPDRTYAALLTSRDRIGTVRALRRPLLAALVIGTSMALSSTRHVTPALVLSTTLLLSVFVIAQVLIALGAIGSLATHTIGRARAVDLFFASHAPWSLWLLAMGAWVPSPLGLPSWPLSLASIAPIVLTPRILIAYFRQIHGLDRRRAVKRTLAHQGVTWSLFAAAFGAAVAIWPRILQALS